MADQLTSNRSGRSSGRVTGTIDDEGRRFDPKLTDEQFLSTVGLRKTLEF